jgi:hypothetical protein
MKICWNLTITYWGIFENWQIFYNFFLKKTTWFIKHILRIETNIIEAICKNMHPQKTPWPHPPKNLLKSYQQ